MGMNLKGWDSLERLMRERKYTEAEIDEARRSFHQGLEILCRLYASFRKQEDSSPSAETGADERQKSLSKVV